MMPVLERVRESIRKDMHGVSVTDASCAAGVILAVPGVVWVAILHWNDFLAYVASL